jgi:hypothetical protein
VSGRLSPEASAILRGTLRSIGFASCSIAAGMKRTTDDGRAKCQEVMIVQAAKRNRSHTARIGPWTHSDSASQAPYGEVSQLNHDDDDAFVGSDDTVRSMFDACVVIWVSRLVSFCFFLSESLSLLLLLALCLCSLHPILLYSPALREQNRHSSAETDSKANVVSFTEHPHDPTVRAWPRLTIPAVSKYLHLL